MVKRCDSVDALRYAYYEMMRIKEENQMLKKNKDYVEFSLQYTSVDWERRSKDCPEVCLKGYSDFSFPGVPIMDVVCNEFDHKVVVVSKRVFDRLQADNQHYRELAKQREENCNLLLKKTGFDTVEELVNYLNSEAECDTLREAIASLEYSVKFARDERRDLSKKLDECEKDYISERDKAEALQTENEQLKKKLQVPDPIPEYKELLEKLHSTEDVEELEWTLNHICGGRASVNGWMVTAKLWRRNYETLSKLIGFSSTEEIQDYLTNEADCDTLHEAILKLIKENKYACEKWCSANSSNNSWKAAAECNSPKELIEKLNLLRDDISGRSTVIEHYKRDIEKWQKATGCLRPEDISAESMISKSMANEITTANEELWSENEKCEKRIESLTSKCTVLEQEIKIYTKALKDWKEITGCPSPSAAKTLIESGMSWHHAFKELNTKFSKAEKCISSRDETIKRLKDDANAWQKATSCHTPIAAKTLIESGMSYEYAYHEEQKKTRKLTEEVDSWKNVTGYSTPEDHMHARISGAFHTPFDYTAAWQKATGCDTPEAAKKRISGLISEAEAWESDYNHLLALTGFDNEGEIEDFLEQNNDRNKLTTVIDNLKLENETMKSALRASNRAMQKELENNIDEWQKFTGCDSPQESGCKINRLCDDICKLKGDYDNLLKLTGYKSEDDVRVALTYSEQFVYETMRELINSLKRKAKFTESNWQAATGCVAPEKAQYKITDLYNRIDKMKEAASIASNWTDKIVEG